MSLSLSFFSILENVILNFGINGPSVKKKLCRTFNNVWANVTVKKTQEKRQKA